MTRAPRISTIALLLSLCVALAGCKPGSTHSEISKAQPPSDHANSDGAMFRGKTFSQWLTVLRTDRDSSYRLIAVKALAELATEGQKADAIKAVKPLLYDEDISIARSAVNSLGRIGGKAVPLLGELLSDESYRHRDYAAIALAVNNTAEAKQYVRQLIAMSECADHTDAIAATEAIILIGPNDKESMAALSSALSRFARPKKGVVNNLAASRILRIFGKCTLTPSLQDQMFLALLKSGNVHDQDLGGQLIVRFASNDSNVRKVLVSHYENQLTDNKQRRLKPGFHDSADNAFLLQCKLDALSNAHDVTTPSYHLMSSFLHDLRNLRVNYSNRTEDERPRGDCDPSANPDTIPFLIRLLEETPLEPDNRIVLIKCVDLLSELGTDAKKATESLLKLDKAVQQDVQQYPLLARSIENALKSIAPKQD